LLGAAMDVVDAGVSLVDAGEGVVLDRHPGVGAMGEGVDGHGFEVAGLDEVVEGLRRFGLCRRCRSRWPDAWCGGLL
jgi:hypothetical protein